MSKKIGSSHEALRDGDTRSICAAPGTWLTPRRFIQAYFFSQSAKVSAKARYPGRPFSMARMARLPLM